MIQTQRYQRQNQRESVPVSNNRLSEQNRDNEVALRVELQYVNSTGLRLNTSAVQIRQTDSVLAFTNHIHTNL